MRILTHRVVIAFFAFVVGVASASLYVVQHHQIVKEAPPLHLISVPERLNHPEGWQKISVGNKFSFYLPPDMQKPGKPKPGEAVMNVEYIGTTEFFRNKDLTINYSYLEKYENEIRYKGRISCEALLSRSPNNPGYRRTEVEIDGKRATQEFLQFSKFSISTTSLCFPDLRDDTFISIGAISKDERALGIAQQIFNSIEFPQ